MFDRRIFAFSLLSVLAFSGCVNSSENPDDDPQVPVAVCGNKTLDAGEDCDGTNFAEGKGVCPEGMTGTVTCGSDCKVVTTACQTEPDEQAVCGNKTLDAGEDCDGTNFAEGKGVCPEGTIGTVSCGSDCKAVTTGCREAGADPICGDGEVNAAGEDCENSVSGVINASGVVVTCEHFEGMGATGTLKCANCTFDSSDCKSADADDLCGNGTLDDGEVCDKSAFVKDAGDACGADYKAKENLVCTNDCRLDVAQSCERICGNGVIDAGEDCDGEAVPTDWTCPSGMVKADAFVCDSSTCKIYTPGSCKTNACGNGVIDGVEACDGEAFAEAARPSCNDGMVAKPNKSDWKCTDACTVDNAKSCEIAGECSNSADLIKCENNVAMLCLDGKWQEWNACSEYEICSEDESADSVDYCVAKTCTDEEENVHKCSDNGTVENLCVEGEWLSVACDAGEVCVEGEGCVVQEVKTCGNGYQNPGEQCETIDGYFVPWGYEPVNCNYYNEKYPNDGYTLYKSGEPTCTDECKISIENCVKLTDDDFTQVKSWNIDSMEEIISLNKSGEVTIHNAGNSGFDSKYSSNAWELGKWPSGNVNWDAYVWFKAGTVSTNAVSITFYAKRGNNGPKKVQVKAYSNGQAESNKLGVSKELILNTAMEKYTVQFKSKSTIGDFSFKVSAYNGDGSMFIQDVKVSSANAI